MKKKLTFLVISAIFFLEVRFISSEEVGSSTKYDKIVKFKTQQRRFLPSLSSAQKEYHSYKNGFIAREIDLTNPESLVSKLVSEGIETPISFHSRKRKRNVPLNRKTSVSYRPIGISSRAWINSKLKGGRNVNVRSKHFTQTSKVRKYEDNDFQDENAAPNERDNLNDDAAENEEDSREEIFGPNELDNLSAENAESEEEMKELKILDGIDEERKKMAVESKEKTPKRRNIFKKDDSAHSEPNVKRSKRKHYKNGVIIETTSTKENDPAEETTYEEFSDVNTDENIPLRHNALAYQKRWTN